MLEDQDQDGTKDGSLVASSLKQQCFFVFNSTFIFSFVMCYVLLCMTAKLYRTYDLESFTVSQSLSFCSSGQVYMMFVCRPFSWLTEFTAVINTDVYIPPQADTGRALGALYSVISKQETLYPEVAFITTGDFNNANWIVLPFSSTLEESGCSTTVKLPSGTCTKPFLVHHLANQISAPCCSCPSVGRSWNRKLQPSGQCIAGRTNQNPHSRTVLVAQTGTYFA